MVNDISGNELQRTNIHYWLALKLVPRLAVHKKLAIVNSVGLRELFLSSSVNPTLNLTPKQQFAIQHPEWSMIDNIIVSSEQ